MSEVARTKEEIEAKIGSLRARQTELDGFLYDYLNQPAYRQDRKGHEATLFEASKTIGMWREEWIDLQRKIDVLRWASGEWEHMR